MVVNKKLDKNDTSGDALKYISKGGQVAADMVNEEIRVTFKAVCMRVPRQLIKAVDSKVRQRAGLTRTAWILEAIQQKLKAEGADEQRESQGREAG